MSDRQLNIRGRLIGPDQPCFLIAEAGVNHNGSMEAALRLIDVAAEAGVDAIKFQSFVAERLVTADAPKADYQKQATSQTESQLEMLQRLELGADEHRQLAAYCEQRGVLFLSTPFDEEAADFLEELGVAAYKVPSGELTNLPYLEHLARKSKPLIVSTGMASLGEVEEAVRTITAAGNQQYVLLHCVSDYPAAPKDVNLRAMHTLQQAFRCLVGYSDHTLGIEISLASAALGACVIEKHFTLDRTLPGPDHAASLEPRELTAMVQGIRKIESALGDGRKAPVESERSTARVARKSLVAAADIPAGTVLTTQLIASKRPGTGLPPAMKPYLLNRTTRGDIPAGALLQLEMVS